MNPGGVSAGGVNGNARMLSGIAWATLAQVISAAANFVSMLVLVRVVAPAEYGKVGAVLGVLQLLNVFGCSGFIAHALQVPAGEEPEWSRHLGAGVYIQGALALVCHLVAGVYWTIPGYRPIAPLLHIAACGLLFEPTSRLGYYRRERALEFRQLRTAAIVATFVSIATTVLLALLGLGAAAIVLGNNVVLAIVWSVDLLVVQRWRPGRGWWRWPDWRGYRASLRFGYAQVGFGLLGTLRALLEAVVLPATLGFLGIGLFSRAQALYLTTVGRVNGALTDTAYPLLARSAADAAQFRRYAALYAQVAFLVVVPCALYVGIEGPALSRLAYGHRWEAADLLLWPGAIIGLGLSVGGVCSSIVLAASRLRRYLVLSAASALFAFPALVLVLRGGGLHAYAWAVALGQCATAAVSLGTVMALVGRAWLARAVLPPAVATAVGSAGLLVARGQLTGLRPVAHLGVETLVYGVAVTATLRVLFPTSMTAMLGRIPAGARVTHWLRLPPLSPDPA